MKRMPLPFEFEGKGVLDVDLILTKNQSFHLNNTFCGESSASPRRFLEKNRILERSSSSGGGGFCYNSSFGEPTSVLDSTGIPSRPTSSSTPSSSGGGGGGGGDGVGQQKQDSTTATSASNVVAALGGGGHHNTLPNVALGGRDEKFSIEDWESVLSDDVSPGQEPSADLRWIMSAGGGAGGGDVEDPYKVLQLSTTGKNNSINHQGFEFDFHGGFGAVDQENFCGLGGGLGLVPVDLPILDHRSSSLSPNLSSNLSNLHTAGGFNVSMGFDPFSSVETKPTAAAIFNSELFISHNQSQQTQNHPSFFYPLTHHQIESNPFLQPPQAKRHNPGISVMETLSLAEVSKGSYSFEPNHIQNDAPHQLQFLTHPHYQEQAKMGSQSHSLLGQPHNQSIIDQLFKAAESVQTGNLTLAHAILARLNHQVSDHLAKPFHRAAFYCKEALQLALLSSDDRSVGDETTMTPLNLVFKIGACKSFSEASPVVQFGNFSCNQAILESVEGLGRVRVVDFDIGFGGQWSSLMQELSFINGVSLKITVIPSTVHGHLEPRLAGENLAQFARDVNLPFEFEVLTIDSFPFHAPEDEGVVVNLPASVFAGNQLPTPAVLRFVKQLSPRIIVSVDRGCDRTDLPFASHMVHVLQHHSSLLESLEAVNMNAEPLQKIERFLLQPGIERMVSNRFRSMEKMQHWRALFLSSGFSPVGFSNLAESQAECVVKRSHVRGFTVEKRQSCLVLCWQRKELVSVSAWRC